MEQKDKCHGYQNIKIELPSGVIWFRRSLDQTEKAEILTNHGDIANVLRDIAADYPEIVTVLTEEGEENFHCVVGPELTLMIPPCSGVLEWSVLTGDEDEKAERSNT